MSYLLAVVMGLVEGITEFLPVSSTGHLVLADEALGFGAAVGERFATTFEVVIQLGAILAVVVAYPGRFAGLLRLGRNEGFSGLRGIGLLALTSVPASLVGLAAKDAIEARLFNPASVAVALAVGAVWILVVERLKLRSKIEGLDAVTWKEALAVGLFQCLSLWPGMSRSASTILGAMIVGVDRKTATEYSFFAAVPIMIAATGYTMLKSWSGMTPEQAGVLAVGFVVSFVSALAAVKLLVRFLTRHTLAPFGWYRLAVAGIFVALVLAGLVRL